MKKSEITVSMPMTTYEEFEQYKKRYKELLDELKSCFNTQLFDTNTEASIDFDVIKALNIAKKTLPAKYNGIYVNYNV